MREYEVVITSNAVVTHTYRVQAISPADAKEKVKTGMVACESEEVYGEQETDCEVTLLRKERR